MIRERNSAMWRKRKTQEPAAKQPAAQEAAPHADWLVQFREEQKRQEQEEWEASQALPDEAERKAAELQAIVARQQNATNYAAMVSNIMHMKHQTAQGIIGNFRN
jgi:hypothetical protein